MVISVSLRWYIDRFIDNGLLLMPLGVQKLDQAWLAYVSLAVTMDGSEDFLNTVVTHAVCLEYT